MAYVHGVTCHEFLSGVPFAFCHFKQRGITCLSADRPPPSGINGFVQARVPMLDLGVDLQFM